MTQPPVQNDWKRRPPRWLPALILALILLAVTACLGRGGQKLVAGNQALLGGEARLACTQDCSDRALCGDSTDRGKVVLLASYGPVTQGLNMAVPVDTAVQIVETSEQPMINVYTGQEFVLTFYRVAIENRPEPGWTPGWCLVGTPQQ